MHPLPKILRNPSTAIAAVLLLTLNGVASAAGPTGRLNDTGQTQCHNGTGFSMVACDAATVGDTSAHPGQDGRFGRDAAPGVLLKVGSGSAGFDFTKVCGDGTLKCTGAANSGVAPAATDWACTKDNVTNLIWSLAHDHGEWTTYANSTYPDAINATGRCGYSTGWRLPKASELLSIMHNGVTTYPAIDMDYFPDTQDEAYWASEQHFVSPTKAWAVDFHTGKTYGQDKPSLMRIRLVRSGD